MTAVDRRLVRRVRDRTTLVGPGLQRSKNRVLAGPVHYDDLVGTPPTVSPSEMLPRDTYIDEEFTIPEFRQLVIGGEVTLLGSASLNIQGTLVIV